MLMKLIFNRIKIEPPIVLFTRYYYIAQTE